MPEPEAGLELVVEGGCACFCDVTEPCPEDAGSGAEVDVGVATAILSCIPPEIGLAGGCKFRGEATLERGPYASLPSAPTGTPAVSNRGLGLEDPREGRLGLDSTLFDRTDPCASYFSLSFSQLQPGSTARLLILSMSARLRALLASPPTPFAKDVDGRKPCDWELSSCERDCDMPGAPVGV